LRPNLGDALLDAPQAGACHIGLRQRGIYDARGNFIGRKATFQLTQSLVKLREELWRSAASRGFAHWELRGREGHGAGG
jgi:hypothetical protein